MFQRDFITDKKSELLFVEQMGDLAFGQAQSDAEMLQRRDSAVAAYCRR